MPLKVIIKSPVFAEPEPVFVFDAALGDTYNESPKLTTAPLLTFVILIGPTTEGMATLPLHFY